MRFLREICRVPENKFRASIHTFTHANVEKTEKYWSKISRISCNLRLERWVNNR